MTPAQIGAWVILPLMIGLRIFRSPVTRLINRGMGKLQNRSAPPKPRHVEIAFHEAGGGAGFVARTCPSYICRNLPSFAALLAFVREKAARHPDAVIFTTLDDYGQALYTSDHAIEGQQLDWIDDDTPFAVEDEAESGPAEAESLFRLVRANILARAEGLTFASLAGRLDWGHPDAPPFEDLNAKPDVVLDAEHHVMLVPVENAWEAIAAFPNGYFHGDLTPMENLVLARHLQQSYGYRLFGVGASYIGFLRDGPIAPASARALAADILSLHRPRNGDFDPAEPERIASTLQARDWLLLFYSGR